MDEVLERTLAAVGDLLQRPAWAASADEHGAVVAGAQIAINQLTASGLPARHGVTDGRTSFADRPTVFLAAGPRSPQSP